MPRTPRTPPHLLPLTRLKILKQKNTMNGQPKTNYLMEQTMNPLDTNADGDKIAPQPGMFHPVRAFVYIIFGLQLLIAAMAYAFLPDRMPIHWKAAGQINGYGPKLLAAMLLPAGVSGTF